jgi:hypothetical protein
MGSTRRGPFGSANGSTSFIRALQANPGKTLVLAGVVVLIAALEGIGYLRDTRRPSSVRFLFTSHSG